MAENNYVALVTVRDDVSDDDMAKARRRLKSLRNEKAFATPPCGRQLWWFAVTASDHLAAFTKAEAMARDAFSEIDPGAKVVLVGAPQLKTVEQAINELKVSRTTLYVAIRTSKIPVKRYRKMGDRRVMYDMRQLRPLFEARVR